MSPIVVAPPPRAIVLNSIGAGNRNTTSNSPMTTTFSHTVLPGNNRRMYAYVAVSHDSWLNSYTALGASSSVDGAFTLVTGPVLFGDSSGYRQGSVALFELVNPSVGVHTITLNVSASQWLSVIGGNTCCFNNVGGRDTPVTQAQTTTNGALNVLVTSSPGDMLLHVSAFSSSPTFSGGQPAPWYSVGSSVNGNADYLVSSYHPGQASFTFSTSTTAHKVGAIGINLIKA